PYYLDLLTGIQNRGIMIPLLDQRRCQGARRKAAAPGSHGRNERDRSSKAGVVRYSLASRARARPLVHWPENRIGLGEAGVFLPDVGLISLSFPLVLGPLVLDAGFPFRAQSRSAPDSSGRNRAQASAT